MPWVGLSYVVVEFPGHTHIPFGFPIASQANCELDICFTMNMNTGRFETFYS